MTSSSDRRVQPRIDIVGALWGQLALSEPAAIRNVSVGGALVDSPVVCALNAAQTVCVMVDGQPVIVEARVCHVEPIHNGPATRYAVGLEFVSPPLSVLNSIEQLSTDL